jgi:hypothetical protein
MLVPVGKAPRVSRQTAMPSTVGSELSQREQEEEASC